MDRMNPMAELFSRGASPPPQNTGPYAPGQQYRPSSPNTIDSLFQGIGSNPAGHQSQGALPGSYVHSEPNSPIMQHEEGANPTFGPPNIQSTERQNALLSLFGGAPAPGNGARGQPQAAGPHLQQVPTPPGSSQQQRGGMSPNDSEAQGKFLLDQLMSGNGSKSKYPESQSSAPSASAPSPQNQRDIDYHSREQSFSSPQETPRDLSQRTAGQPPQGQQQPPSPTTKSMFDYVSPFDAFASPSSGTSSLKKKQGLAPSNSTSGNEDSWTTVSAASDPKRKSVENLMDQLTRGQMPPPGAQDPIPGYESYITGGAGADLQQPENIQPRGAVPPPPLPPKPPRGAMSPNSSPPAMQGRPLPRIEPAQAPAPASLGPSSTSTLAPQPAGGRKEKEHSPGPRGGKAKAGGGKGKAQTGAAGAQTPSVVFDVSLDHNDIQSPLNAVTPIPVALVKQDAVWCQGTTIGVTKWIAYAMTRGRIRIISRTSGARGLLQLPPTFPTNTGFIDVSVFSNRLAAITSDGGLCVWELPEDMFDDAPGQLVLCVLPYTDPEGLRSVKWHPKQHDTLAVSSQSRIYLFDLTDATRTFRDEPIHQADLARIGKTFVVNSAVVAFDFDTIHFAIATICEDSTLSFWSIRDTIPFSTHKVRGDEPPSSITLIEDGIVVGRKKGTIYQILSGSTKNVLSTIKFTNGAREDPDMFGNMRYDSRIQTLWIANSRRDSIIAFKLGYESRMGNTGDFKAAFVDQVVEFSGPKPSIHFVILSEDADPYGNEAREACMVANIQTESAALVMYSAHSGGVDQVLITKEQFDNALSAVTAKFPLNAGPNPPATAAGPQIIGMDPKGSRHTSTLLSASQPQGPLDSAYGRPRTPQSEELEDSTRDEARPQESRGKGNKGKNVGWKDKDDSGNGKDKDKNARNSDSSNDTSLSQVLSREIRKSEENLHTRIGRLIGKEMDKQHARLEEARASEQAEDFARQEKILKLISTELTKNTTRVVEVAVKSVVQNSVLPSLEAITRNEVKSALNEQVGQGLGEYIQQSLPIEIEKLILRPDITTHFAHIVSSSLNPLIDRYVKDAVNKNFIPQYTSQSSAQHQDLVREVRSEVHTMKKEITSWQNDAFRSQESLIRDLEHSVRTLSEQVKFLSMSPPSAGTQLHHHAPRNSPGASSQHSAGGMSQHHMRQPNQQPVQQQPTNYNQGLPYQQQQSQPPGMHGPWYSPIAAPQASHPLAPPPPPPPPRSPAQQEEWDDTYLAVLGTNDQKQLRELLSRSSPDVIMPLNGQGPLSQAVILTLLHRLSAVIGETPPVDEAFKTSLWWLQRTASTLNTSDPLISPYVARVVPNVQQMLHTTRQRLAILPGGPQLETTRTLAEIQDILSRKPK